MYCPNCAVQMTDNYQDWAGGPAISNLVGGNSNGRHFDDLIPNGTAFLQHGLTVRIILLMQLRDHPQ